MEEVPLLPMEAMDRDVPFSFVEGIPLTGLDQPSDVEFQPIVYVVWPPWGQPIEVGEEGEEGLSYMIFSRQPIEDITLPSNVSLGENVFWSQQEDRYWELVIKDVTKDPFNATPGETRPVDINFSVTFKDGPAANISSSVDVLDPELPTEPEIVITEHYREYIEGRILFPRDDDGNQVPIRNGYVCLIKKDEWPTDTDWKDYMSVKSGRKALAWVKDIPLVCRTSTDADGNYSLNVDAIGKYYNLKVATGPQIEGMEFYLVAQTNGARSTRQRPPREDEVKDDRPMPWHDGEAVNFYTDGKTGEHDWATYGDPFAAPDIVISYNPGLPPSFSPNQSALGYYEVSGGKVTEDNKLHEADIIFPFPIVWVHGVDAQKGGGHPSGALRALNFFSHPDPNTRQVVDCSLAYVVDTMDTFDLGCLANAERIERYMVGIYDSAMKSITPKKDGQYSPPPVNLIAHSMGGPISRIWNAGWSKDHGGVENYISCSGIQGGNQFASQAQYFSWAQSWMRPWLPAFGPIIDWMVGESGKDCAVSRIKGYDKDFNYPDGKWFFSFGVNGIGTMGNGMGGAACALLPGERGTLTKQYQAGVKFFAVEPHPNDGENSAPTATCQNGPYLKVPYDRDGNRLSGPGELGEWKHFLERDIDMRETIYGKAVFRRKLVGKIKMGYIDFADGNLIMGDPLYTYEEPFGQVIHEGSHGAVYMHERSLASQADWLELGCKPDSMIPRAYVEASEFAEWPGDHQLDLDRISSPPPSPTDKTREITRGEEPLEPEEDGSIIFKKRGRIQADSTLEYAIPVDIAGAAMFSLEWGHLDGLLLSLVDPGNNTISPATVAGDPNVEFIQLQDSYGPAQYYACTDPQAGLWTVRVTAGSETSEGGVEFQVGCALSSTLFLDYFLSSSEIMPGETTTLTAAVGRWTTATDPEVLTDNLNIKSTVFKPDGTVGIAMLYDDGLHGDGEAGDGYFANQLTSLSQMGDYQVLIDASGVDEFGNLFNRLGSRVFSVGSGNAGITGPQSESAVSGTDDLYAGLSAEIGITVSERGTFLIGAFLTAADNTFIDSGSVERTLDPGSYDVEVEFLGRRIGDSLRDGPYMIGNISVSEVVTNNINQDQRLYPGATWNDGTFLTAAYDYLDFEFTDYDGDRMADTWEEINGLDTGVDDADQDPDGDGYSNLEEYNGGTDPQNDQSHPGGLPFPTPIQAIAPTPIPSR